MSAGDRVLVPDICDMNSDASADILTSDGTHYRLCDKLKMMVAHELHLSEAMLSRHVCNNNVIWYG